MVGGNTKDAILDVARLMVQANGYNALSFRDVAAAIGVKSASIHYHFPTKGDLAAAVAARYADEAAAALETVLASPGRLSARIDAFVGFYRAALAQDNRMCLIGIMAAEQADLPPEARAEVKRFSEICVDYLSRALAAESTSSEAAALHDRAFALYAAIQGAQLVARGRDDIAVFDELIAHYRKGGFLP